MSVENKELLIQQLKQQEKMFVTEDNDVQLIQSMLITCSALLRIAEKSMPSSFTQEDFNKVYAGFLGVSSKVNGFYISHKNYFSEEQSQVLGKLLENLHSLESIKKKLDEEISSVLKKIANQNQQITYKKEELLEKKKTQKKLEGELIKKQNELIDTENKINRFEPDIKRLIEAVNEANATYTELVAYYAELDRIQNGIREEGYVDIVSFSQKLQEMNVQRNSLMTLYDELLRNISDDVKTLQEKIKRKAGVKI